MEENSNTAAAAATEQSLRDTIRRLQGEIQAIPRSDVGSRRVLQHELEGTYHRLAELVETERVEQVKLEAVASGLVIETERNFLRNLAQGGNGQAQLLTGREFLNRWQSTDHTDHQAKAQAIHWLTLAAGQGNMEAQVLIASLWVMKVVTPLCSSDDMAMRLLTQPARLGWRSAQSALATLVWKQGNRGDVEVALIWYTLAAAQGHPEAQFNLSKPCGIDNDMLGKCTSLYWSRKASMQGFHAAHPRTATLLNDIKRDLFDGINDAVGYSGVPEYLFWTRLWLKDPKEISIVEGLFKRACACCGKSGKPKACKGCRAVAYCGKKCQKEHWDVGHKIDCRPVKSLEKAMKANSRPTSFYSTV